MISIFQKITRAVICWLWITMLSFYTFCLEAKAQGCSDAGFCTMGAMKPHQPYGHQRILQLRNIEMGQYLGITRFGDYIYNTYLEGTWGIGTKTNIQAKLPFVYVDGFWANTSGIGDLSLSITRSITNLGSGQLSGTLGSKIPTGYTTATLNSEGEERPLPMYYQGGLGTVDLIAGLSYIDQKWLFATGLQHAFGSPENTFSWAPWNGTNDIDSAAARLYTASVNLRRGTDLMLRIERSFRMSNKSFSLGLLPIYRLNKDLKRDPDGTFSEVEGSDGLALTATTAFTYRFNTIWSTTLLFGQRIIQREKNPDGLSRERVLNLSISYALHEKRHHDKR
jgi:hypothetical protein